MLPFPDAQFHTENYLTFRRDRNKHGGGIFTFAKSRLLLKHISDLESNIIEILPLEIRINKSKWIVLNIYGPPASNFNLLSMNYLMFLIKASPNTILS